MADPVLDDEEKEIVRCLARKYVERGEDIDYEDFNRKFTLNDQESFSLRNRLKAQGLIEDGISDGDVRVLPACVELVRQWDNPPLPDYRDRLTKWFWSKPWSLAAYLVVVGLPAMVGYIVMAKTILEWLGIFKGISPK